MNEHHFSQLTEIHPQWVSKKVLFYAANSSHISKTPKETYTHSLLRREYNTKGALAFFPPLLQCFTSSGTIKSLLSIFSKIVSRRTGNFLLFLFYEKKKANSYLSCKFSRQLKKMDTYQAIFGVQMYCRSHLPFRNSLYQSPLHKPTQHTLQASTGLV